MARIYVASSWRNTFYPEVVARLREAGHEVYDFRNPPHGGNGFRWTDIDENAPHWTFSEYAEGLHHPKAERQFQADLEALAWAWYRAQHLPKWGHSTQACPVLTSPRWGSARAGDFRGPARSDFSALCNSQLLIFKKETAKHLQLLRKTQGAVLSEPQT